MSEDKKFTGHGTYEFPNGNTYTGEFVNGQPEGSGIMEFSNHDRYEGDWKAGKIEGVGEYHYFDSKKDRFVAEYKGQFKEGKRVGVGRMKFSNRNIYDGQWQNNMRTGNGVCWFNNGDCFSGLWRFDEMLRGVYHLASGDKYDGEIKEGKFEGYGKYFWRDGKWYEGSFKDGKPFTGLVIYPDGKLSEYQEGEQK